MIMREPIQNEERQVGTKAMRVTKVVRNCCGDQKVVHEKDTSNPILFQKKKSRLATATDKNM